MVRAKTYDYYQRAIEKLMVEQDVLKDKKLNALFKNLRTKSFEQKVLKTDAPVLKVVAKNFIKEFDSMVADVSTENSVTKRKTRLDVTIPASTKKKLFDYAERKHLSVSVIIQMLIEKNCK